MGMFTLPETHAAFLRWQQVTGLGADSPEWGEVCQVLKDTELLRADQCPQRALFDPPELALGDTTEVVALRLAIIVGATLHRRVMESAQYHPRYQGHDLATCTAIVAALVGQFYDLTGLTFEQALLQVETKLWRRVLGVVPAPSVALMWQAKGTEAMEKLGPDSVATQVLRAAFDDDEFAVRVFARTADDPGHRLALAPLRTGSWLVYDSTPAP